MVTLQPETAAFHDALREMPVIWFRFDNEGLLTECSGGGLKRLGLKPNLPVGRSVFKDFPQVADKFKEALAGNSVFYEINGDHNGEPWSFFTHISFDAARGSGAIGFSIDITERQKANKAFRLNQNRISSIFRAAPIGIGVVSNRTVIEVNEQVCQMLGYSQEELVGRHARLIYPTDEEYNRGGIIETQWQHKNGSIMDVLLSSSPIDSNNLELGITFCAMEITERTKVERERLKLLKELEQAVRIRDDFLSVASHELRTPLTALQLKIQTLKRLLSKQDKDAIMADRLSKTFKTIEEQIDSSTRLINDMLDMSRLKAGHLHLDPKPLDLGQLVENVARRHEEEGLRAGCCLTICKKGNTTGIWDCMRLEQVVTNLLFNAFKYGANNPVEVTIEDKQQAVRLSICDYGIGIAPEDQKRIFACFEQAVPRHHYGGLGLGLWIVNEIVQACDGTIKVESSPGRGSTFSIELPRHYLESSISKERSP